MLQKLELAFVLILFAFTYCMYNNIHPSNRCVDWKNSTCNLEKIGNKHFIALILVLFLVFSKFGC